MLAGTNQNFHIITNVLGVLLQEAAQEPSQHPWPVSWDARVPLSSKQPVDAAGLGITDSMSSFPFPGVLGTAEAMQDATHRVPVPSQQHVHALACLGSL